MNPSQSFFTSLVFAGFACCNALVSAPLYATPTTPNDPATVIAHWPVDKAPRHLTRQNNQLLDSVSALAETNQYLSQANRPGQSRLYGLAQACLQPLITKGTENIDVWLALSLIHI